MTWKLGDGGMLVVGSGRAGAEATTGESDEESRRGGVGKVVGDGARGTWVVGDTVVVESGAGGAGLGGAGLGGAGLGGITSGSEVGVGGSVNAVLWSAGALTIPCLTT